MVLVGVYEILGLWWRSGGDIVNVGRDLHAVPIQREVVGIVTERVLDLAANGSDAENDVGGYNGAGDGDPVEEFPELEWQRNDVDPGDLTNGNGICDRERGVEHALCTGKDFVEGSKIAHDHSFGDAFVQGRG